MPYVGGSIHTPEGSEAPCTAPRHSGVGYRLKPP